MKKTFSRRQVIKAGGGMLGALCVPTLLRPQFSFASGPGDDHRFVILISQNGGVDGLAATPLLGTAQQNALNALRPSYQQGIVNSSIPIAGTSDIALASYWSALNAQLSPGNMRLFSQIGFTDGMNGSHDLAKRAMSYGTNNWTSLDGRGLIARLIDAYQGTFTRGTVYGLNCGLQADFNTSTQVPILTSSLASYRWGEVSTAPAENTHIREVLNDALDELSSQNISPQELRLIQQHQAIDQGVALVRNVSQAYTPPSGNPYPNTPTGALLLDVARIIKSSIDTDSPKKLILYLVQPGLLDTHANQPSIMTDVLGELSTALARLIADLRAWNVWNKSAIYMFSEFGRKTLLNGPMPAPGQQGPVPGTDHGTGNIHMLLSGALSTTAPVVLGTIPTAAQLNNPSANLPVTFDVRNVWRELFQFLNVPGFNPSLVFPTTYPVVNFSDHFVS